MNNLIHGSTDYKGNKSILDETQGSILLDLARGSGGMSAQPLLTAWQSEFFHHSASTPVHLESEQTFFFQSRGPKPVEGSPFEVRRCPGSRVAQHDPS
jgi:hypothetical protein